MTPGRDPTDVERLDEALSAWRQGDCVLGEHWFVHRASPPSVRPDGDEGESLEETSAPSLGVFTRACGLVGHWLAPRPVPSPEEAEGDGEDLVETQVLGLVVLTQTCDLVRTSAKRPFVEVAPLVEVSEAELHQIERGRKPQYGYICGVADRRLVVDLDRTMTVHKEIVATWERTPGWATDAEVRRIQRAAARKRERFAFPDEFVRFVDPLQRRILDKHDRQSEEGAALRALREIRVRAAPAWDAADVELFFWFIRDPEDRDFDGESWATLLAKWLERLPKTERFPSVDGVVVTLEDMTAADYVESDPLDLDHLSLRPGER